MLSTPSKAALTQLFCYNGIRQIEKGKTGTTSSLKKVLYRI